MNIADKTGRALYYIFGALSLVGISNIFIQIAQLYMLGKLTIPGMSWLFDLPWYILMGFGIPIGLLILLAIGYLWAKFGIAAVQTKVLNENNPQLIEIMKQLNRIEKATKRRRRI